jgi:hypothetical protein
MPTQVQAHLFFANASSKLEKIKELKHQRYQQNGIKYENTTPCIINCLVLANLRKPSRTFYLCFIC